MNPMNMDQGSMQQMMMMTASMMQYMMSGNTGPTAPVDKSLPGLKFFFGNGGNAHGGSSATPGRSSLLDGPHGDAAHPDAAASALDTALVPMLECISGGAIVPAAAVHVQATGTTAMADKVAAALKRKSLAAAKKKSNSTKGKTVVKDDEDEDEEDDEDDQDDSDGDDEVKVTKPTAPKNKVKVVRPSGKAELPKKPVAAIVVAPSPAEMTAARKQFKKDYPEYFNKKLAATQTKNVFASRFYQKVKPVGGKAQAKLAYKVMQMFWVESQK